MGAQLQNLYNQGAIQQGNDYNTTLGNYFNQTTPTSPYWGTYTAPMNINPIAAQQPQYDSRGKLIKLSKNSSKSPEDSFNNPSPLPNYSMYIAPEQMPNINAYLQNPNSLLGAMQESGVPSAGAGRFSNLLSTNTTGNNNV